jgi:uncharacterized protein (TIGR03118 family)
MPKVNGGVRRQFSQNFYSDDDCRASLESHGGKYMLCRLGSLVFTCTAALLPLSVSAATLDAFSQTNLTSDLSGVAQNTDPLLVNAWGIVAGPSTPFWISDNGSGMSTVYNGAGQPFPLATPIQVAIPGPGGVGSGAPTGIVFNGTSGFGGAHFLFATEDGTIADWTSGSSAMIGVDNSASGAVYKGLALANGNLYAANFNAGTIDVFDSSFMPITVPGGFADPNIPSGFAPFDIQFLNGQFYVTYALQDAAKHDDVAGPGNGYVDIFNADGTLQKRLISNGALNSPWGLTLAPTGFGPFGGDLLVGNFGDGTINAYDPNNGAFVGVLMDANGNPIVNQGLWGLSFGNGKFGTDTGALYFTAGIPGPDTVESHGLFGSLAPVPEPVTISLCAAGLGLLALRRRKLT